MRARIFAQIAIGIAIQIGVFFIVGIYWVICSTPVVFALFGAVNFHEVDATTERYLKRMLTLVTVASLAAAYAYQHFLR